MNPQENRFQGLCGHTSCPNCVCHTPKPEVPKDIDYRDDLVCAHGVHLRMNCDRCEVKEKAKEKCPCEKCQKNGIFMNCLKEKPQEEKCPLAEKRGYDAGRNWYDYGAKEAIENFRRRITKEIRKSYEQLSGGGNGRRILIQLDNIISSLPVEEPKVEPIIKEMIRDLTFPEK